MLFFILKNSIPPASNYTLMYFIAQNYALLHWKANKCTVLYCIAPYFSLFPNIHCCTALQLTLLYSTALHPTELYYIRLHPTVLSVLHPAVIFIVTLRILLYVLHSNTRCSFRSNAYTSGLIANMNIVLLLTPNTFMVAFVNAYDWYLLSLSNSQVQVLLIQAKTLYLMR